MTISQLIEHVGNENCMIQWLPECQIRADSGEHGTRITFETNGITTNELAVLALTGTVPRNVGIVVWLPVEKLPEELRRKLFPDMREAIERKEA